MKKRYEVYCAGCEKSLGWYWTLRRAIRAMWLVADPHDLGVANRKGMSV